MLPKRNTLILLLVLTCLMLLTDFGEEQKMFAEAKKKKGKSLKGAKKQKKKAESADVSLEELPMVSSPKRPLEIGPRLYCHACQLMVDYAVDALGPRTSEADILAIVEPSNICDWKIYERDPKLDLKGVKATLLVAPCEAILASYEDEFIQTLTNRFDIHTIDP